MPSRYFQRLNYLRYNILSSNADNDIIRYKDLSAPPPLYKTNLFQLILEEELYYLTWSLRNLAGGEYELNASSKIITLFQILLNKVFSLFNS